MTLCVGDSAADGGPLNRVCEQRARARAPSPPMHRPNTDPLGRYRPAKMVSMWVGVELGDRHECRGCWPLQEGTFENEFEEIVSHEDPRGRFIVITNARCGTERYAIDDPMTKAYIEARGLDWR